jgi:hypothetical protein
MQDIARKTRILSHVNPAENYLDRLMRAMLRAEPETPAPAEIRKILPALDQRSMRAPQLLPRVAASIEEELVAYRQEKAQQLTNRCR